MLVLLLFVGWSHAVQEVIGPHAAYEVVLIALKQEHAGSELYLANVPARRFQVAKDIRPAADDLLHPPEWIRDIQQRRLVAGSCTPPESQVGCRGVVHMAGPDPISVQFWPLEAGARGTAEITVTLVMPPSGHAPHLEKWVYRLEAAPNREWRIVSRTRVGVT